MSSNVIKARTVLTATGPAVVKRKVQIACKDADAILAQAKTEAEHIVGDAQRQAQILFESARQDGYQSGAAEWSEALTHAWKARDDYVAANENTLLQLSVRIAEKLIGETLRLSPDAVAGIVREALRSVRRAQSLTIQVHPADLPLVSERLPGLRNAAGAMREIDIVPNASLARGDCVVESDIGIIDARLETQLKNMERALTFAKSV